ncbi:MAG: DUF2441 domain-containing protein [Aureispira sp.]|nr:DUF2441 domain-containing protein [Aureispira sp.]
MTFYHVSHRPLREGTLLTIGAYGERTRQANFMEKHYATYLKEEIFEDIRQQNYPKAPSRFNCIFLFPDFGMAKEFYANTCGYQHYVYEVEIVKGSPFIVEMDLLKCDGNNYHKIKSNAKKYWEQISHPNSGTLEALLLGEAKVKSLILEPSNI